MFFFQVIGDEWNKRTARGTDKKKGRPEGLIKAKGLRVGGLAEVEVAPSSTGLTYSLIHHIDPF